MGLQRLGYIYLNRLINEHQLSSFNLIKVITTNCSLGLCFMKAAREEKLHGKEKILGNPIVSSEETRDNLLTYPSDR